MGVISNEFLLDCDGISEETDGGKAETYSKQRSVVSRDNLQVH